MTAGKDLGPAAVEQQARFAAEANRLHDTLPIAGDLAFKLADDAIGLFLEYRDNFGYGEAEARAQATTEVAEGASTGLGVTLLDGQ